MNTSIYRFQCILVGVCWMYLRPATCFTGSPLSTEHLTTMRQRNVATITRLSAPDGETSTEVDRSDGLIGGQENELISRGSFLSALASAALVVATTSCRADTSLPPTNQPEPTESPNSSSLLINEKKKKLGETFQESISGFVAGGSLTITKTFAKFPLDTATVRLQMPDTDFSIRDPIRLFKGSYRGVLAPLLWNVPGGAVFFAVKDATKSALSDFGLPRWAITSLAVAAAQCPYWFVRNPSEVVKTRQQAGLDGYGEGASTVDAFRMVYEEGKANNSTGLDSFYSGYWENILYAYPADVIKFVCYDTITQGKKNLPPLQGAVAGAASTAVAQLVTTPLDVVRNRIMAGEEPSDEKSPSYVESLAKLAREEGLDGLFAGASPRVGKAIISGAIQFATYEETKQKLNNFIQNR